MTSSRFALGEIHYEMYALVLAREHLEYGLALARSIGSSHWIRQHTGLLAATCLTQGDLPSAEAVLDAGAPPDIAMQTVGQRIAWLARGELALARGNPVAALDIAERLEECATPDERRQMPLVALLHGKALAAAEHYDEAAVWLHAAETTLRAQGARTTLRRVLTELATLYQRMGRADEATRYITEAHDLIRRLAELIPDAVSRTVFTRLALASLPTGMKRLSEITSVASHMLTARERQVAALVTQGKSNRAIADELVISERTTESHVTNILGKLGFRSRAQIAAWAAGIGLPRADHSD
jgi:non-specific serine/threonine protein kinase